MTNDLQTNRKLLLTMLNDYNPIDVKIFVDYVHNLDVATKKGYNSKTKKNTYTLQNDRMKKRTNEFLAFQFKRVENQGLVFDGVHITLQNTGVSYDYQAYKNMMLKAYPDTQIDVQIVYKDEEVNFDKRDGKVLYNHNIGNPFSRRESDITGAYCVIKNKRGEFLTTLTREELDKHKNVAKTQMIRNKRYVEMCMKTIIKKGCKTHFNDIYRDIEIVDNENYDLENTTSGEDLDKIASKFTNPETKK